MALSLRRREAPRGRYTPNLWPVWLVAPAALALALLLGWGIYQYAHDYFAQAAADQKPPKPVNVNDVLKATVTALTLVGAVLAGLYAYRKQLLSEGDAHRADASQLADRYTTAAEQLGHDQAAVRLAGVYALARLADDWEEQRQVCIDVLCAYLRIPYQPDPTQADHKAGEREVRWTIIRVIRSHLLDPTEPTTWCTYTLDFTDATFDGGDLSHGLFLGTVDFGGAQFSGGTFRFSGADFSDGTVDFDSADFSGGTVDFRGADFSGGTVHFRGATFTGGTVDFSGATFTDGTVRFDGAEFSGGTVNFRDAEFSGDAVDFTIAEFSDGTVNFSGATFSGGTFRFDGATFSGGTVHFRDAEFCGGTVDFSRATFSDGTVNFSGATFSGGTFRFDGAMFSDGVVAFAGATFSGSTVDFSGATFFNGTVNFNSATFSGGTVNFRGARNPGGMVVFSDAAYRGTVFSWGPFPVPPGA
ncbi:pentapeptide repeat-containing protein [Streptomyces sp. NPDC057199]|uniref:pentapeptide repeat-containing protein n=1 Tax=Streptomyces sp. NPDC057199 TaxID=3346047 RepID=UPI003629E11F